MEDQITFDQFLEQKKIDPAKFRSAESEKYTELAVDFDQMHTDSFTAHYLFLINPIRRKYLLQEQSEGPKPKTSLIARPKFKR